MAVVALPSGKLTWAESFGRDEGLLVRATATPVSHDELTALRAKLPEFLATRAVAAVNTLLSRLTTPDGAPALRPRGRGAVPAASPAPTTPALAAAAADAINQAAALPELPHDLKNVSQAKLGKYTLAQLRELCRARGLDFGDEFSADSLLSALIKFRNKEGRLRRDKGGGDDAS